MLDQALLERPGNADIQLDLFLDYASNVRLYPQFQAYLRSAKPPTLAIWGKNDPFFLPPGAPSLPDALALETSRPAGDGEWVEVPAQDVSQWPILAEQSLHALRR